MSATSVACLKQISNFLQIPVQKINLNNEKMPTCILQNRTVTGFANIISSILKQENKQLIGTNPEEEAEVRQWLEYCVTYLLHSTNSQSTNQIAQELNNFLATRSYFVGNSVTIADVAIFYVLQDAVLKFSHLEKEKYLNLSRWFDNIQQNNSVRLDKPLVDFSTLFLCNSLH